MALTIIEIICLIFASLLLLYYYLTQTFDYWKIRGVKGPKPILIFGNVKDVMRAKISISIFLKNMYDKYKDERMVGIFEKDVPSLILRDPDLIKDVLIKDFSVFPERPMFSNEKVSQSMNFVFCSLKYTATYINAKCCIPLRHLTIIVP